MEDSKDFPKVRINALITQQAYKKMQQEVQKVQQGLVKDLILVLQDKERHNK